MKKLIATLLVAAVWPFVAQAQVSFPYPAIPDVIVDEQARLAYVLEHFWDNYHFDDLSQLNRDTGEQGFVDFINLMQYADSLTCAFAAQTLADSITSTEPRLQHFDGIIDHYLGNPDSPMKNDVTYAHLLRAVTQRLPDGHAAKSRLAFRLALVVRNQPGMLAADFDYIDRQGCHHRLYDIESPLTLIVFSDPECEHCHEIMPRIISNTTLQSDPRLTVLNIYPDDNRKAWEQDVKALPANWREGRSPEGEMMKKQIYALPALPSLYLLDSQKRVLVKDGTLEQVVERIVNSEK
jgi:hypothetical protein